MFLRVCTSSPRVRATRLVQSRSAEMESRRRGLKESMNVASLPCRGSRFPEQRVTFECKFDRNLDDPWNGSIGHQGMWFNFQLWMDEFIFQPPVFLWSTLEGKLCVGAHVQWRLISWIFHCSLRSNSLLLSSKGFSPRFLLIPSEIITGSIVCFVRKRGKKDGEFLLFFLRMRVWTFVHPTDRGLPTSRC